MLNKTGKLRNHQNKPSKNIGAWLFLFLVGMCHATQAQTVTKTIIINQVTDGRSNSALVKGNGITGTERREIQSFQAIKIEGAMKVNYSRAANVKVEVTGDQNLLPQITTQVVRDVLIMSTKQSYQTQQPITIELTSPSLRSVSSLGAGDITLKGLSEKSLQIDIKGSGDVNAEGTVGQLSIHTRGSGDINAKELESIQSAIQNTGSGNITITVKEFLKARIAGSGDITYFGHPKKVEPHISGSGHIVAAE